MSRLKKRAGELLNKLEESTFSRFKRIYDAHQKAIQEGRPIRAAMEQRRIVQSN